MNLHTTESPFGRAAPPDPIDALVDVHAHEPSAAYPALVARWSDRDRGDGVTLRVRPIVHARQMIERLAAGIPTLSILPPVAALRALAMECGARIVGTAVSPLDLVTLDGTAFHRDVVAGDAGPAHAPLRALLVAPARRLEHGSAEVAAAVRSYWRGAHMAASEPALLTAVLASEFGLASWNSEHEARRALGRWRLDPSVDVVALETVLAGLRCRGEVPRHTTLNPLIDPRFVYGASLRG